MFGLRFVLGWLFVLPWMAAVQVLWAQESAGQWYPAPGKGEAWVHSGTGTRWPALLQGHQLKAEFRYPGESGGFIRYEAVEQGSRLDVFFFPLSSEAVHQVEPQKLAVQREIESLGRDLLEMEREGRYKNVRLGPLSFAAMSLWQEETAPMVARMDEMTRLGVGPGGADQVNLLQWSAVVAYRGYLITLRQLRPKSAEASKAMEELALRALRLIKEPALQRGVMPIIEQWLANPFAAEADQWLATCLAYLKGRDELPLALPESSLGFWVMQAGQRPGQAGQALLGAYLLGSGLSLLKGEAASMAAEAGARQVLAVGRELQVRDPMLRLLKFPDFEAAVTKKVGGRWLATQHLE